MNKRNKAILDWVEKNRPGLIEHFKNIIADKSILLQCAIIGFEAGRKFQIEHPRSRLGKPNTFL